MSRSKVEYICAKKFNCPLSSYLSLDNFFCLETLKCLLEQKYPWWYDKRFVLFCLFVLQKKWAFESTESCFLGWQDIFGETEKVECHFLMRFIVWVEIRSQQFISIQESFLFVLYITNGRCDFQKCKSNFFSFCE